MRYITIVMIFMALLSACSSQHEDDLDRWMKDSKAKVKGKAVPLPELKKYEPLVYNANSDLSDPFKGRKAASSDGVLQPDMKRPHEALESYPLESLKFVGFLEQGQKSVALISTPDNNVYQIRVGNYMGQNYGMVSKIDKDELVIKEMVQDGTGGYAVRLVTINPQDTNQPK